MTAHYCQAAKHGYNAIFYMFLGSMIVMCGKTWKLKGLWHKPEDAVKYGYDFWYQYHHNVLISTEWGSPNAWWKGLDPSRVKQGEQY